MSEQAASAEAQPAPKVEAPQAAPAPQVQQIDTEAIVKQARDEATKAANAKLKDIARALTGEPEEKPVDPLLVAFAKNPASVLAEVGIAVEERVEAKMAAKKSQASQAEAIAKPYLEKYPELAQHMDTADAFMKQALANGAQVEDAIKGALETTAKKLNLKSLSEEERQRRVAYAGVPPIGSPGIQSPEAKKSNAMDYVKSLRTNAKAIRGQLPPPK